MAKRALACGTLASAAALLLVAGAGGSSSEATPVGKSRDLPRVLVFTRTLGFHHDSIPAAVAAISSLARHAGVEVTATAKPGVFTRKRLGRYAVVVFVNTTGDVLGPSQQAAFRGYIRKGGGFAGVHSAADTEYDWPFYGGLVGAYFKQHPATQPAVVDVVDHSHPSTRGLPQRWARTDEWYDFRSNPRGSVHVLATVDPASYLGSTMGPDHPIAWCHRHAGGRAWYTGLGHTPESYAEPAFRRHLIGGILWAAGLEKGDCRIG